MPADDSHEIACFVCCLKREVEFEIVVRCKLKVALYGLSLSPSFATFITC